MNILQIVLALVLAFNLPFNVLYLCSIKNSQSTVVDDANTVQIKDVNQILEPLLKDIRTQVNSDAINLVIHHYSDIPYLVNTQKFKYNQPIFGSVLLTYPNKGELEVIYKRQYVALAGYPAVDMMMAGECSFKTIGTIIKSDESPGSWKSGLSIRCPIYSEQTNSVIAHVELIYKELNFDGQCIVDKFIILKSQIPKIMKVLLK